MPDTKATSMKLTPMDHQMIGVICERHKLSTMADAIRFALGHTVMNPPTRKITKQSSKRG